MRLTFFGLLLVFCIAGASAAPTVKTIEPPNWWTGMASDTLQLMLTGQELDGIAVSTSDPGITVLSVESTGNPAYAFVTLIIGPAAHPGTCRFSISKGSSSSVIQYPLLPRTSSAGRYQGFGPDDVIYLITPDRFSDGDTSNNSIDGMRDGYNPGKLIGRHGGDLRGITNHLTYLRDLGVTALWINPLIENDTRMSYHGYASTNLYRIDRRFGTNDEYRELVAEAHRLGLKIIMDHVSNHISLDHPWIANLPESSWLNGSKEHHQNNRHQKALLTDPYSDSTLKSNVTDGWFQDYMPDLNQRNPRLSRYLIQNTIWWIESTGLDGIREDTYSYADAGYMNRWEKAIFTEYPRFNIVGEVWLNDPVYIAPYQAGSRLWDTTSLLPSITDYGLFTPFMRVFGNDKADISVIYECLGKDFLYPTPDKLMTFLDNHDVTRIMSICKGDAQRFKLALTLLLTIRGIPEMLYATELGMAGEDDHGLIRADFPGGFPHDTRDAFTAKGRTPRENDIYDFTHTLLSLRKEHSALRTGRFIHFPPHNNVYVYFRITTDETVMVVINNGGSPVDVHLTDFERYIPAQSRLKDLVTAKETAGTGEIRMDANSAGIYSVIHK
jgi:neopullulanase